jgi:hypothetical protein
MCCVYGVVVSNFISPMLCSAPLRACVCICARLVISAVHDCVCRPRAGFLSTFERLMFRHAYICLPPSSGFSLRLRAPNCPSCATCAEILDFCLF